MSSQTWRSDEAFARVKQVCYAGLGLQELQTAVLGHLRKEMQFSAYCFNRMDPTTELLTGSVGEGVGGVEELRLFMERIYFDDYLLDFRELARSRRPVGLLSRATNGKLEKALRYRVLFNRLGFGDELRGVFLAGHRPWGSVTLFRAKEDPFFGEQEVGLLTRLSPHIGAGMRAAVLLDQAPQSSLERAPGMLLLGPGGRVDYFTPSAERWLEEIEDYPGQWTRARSLPVAVQALVVSLRRALAMQTEAEQDLVPQVTTRGRNGQWITLHASTATGVAGETDRTTVLLGPAVPGEIARVQTSAYGLTPQEEAVCRLVVQGASTQQISQSLFITPYTVQDHLKRIFEKVGVRSRRELVKQLYLTSQSLAVSGHNE